MKRILCILGCLMTYAQAQTLQDAHRFNQMNPTGTARSLGMAGAYTAVGADFTSATLNPAGLGLYRGSDISISPYLNISSSNTDYLDVSGSDSRALPGIGSFGLVFTNTEPAGQLKSWSFAVGYNQLGNYLRRATVTGFNVFSSFSHDLAEQANGIPEADLFKDPGYVYGATELADMAYNTGFDATVNGNQQQFVYLIGPAPDYDESTGNYVYQGAFDIAQIEQTVEYRERGRHNEWAFAWGGNYDDKFYFGAKLGINDLSWRQTRTYTERDVNRVNELDPDDLAILPIDQLQYEQEVRTSGVGVNASVGFTYQPIRQLRMGLALHSPSLLSMRDRFSTSLSLRDDFGNQDTKASAENEFNYRMVLPYRLNFGTMYLIDKIGLLSADVEFTDYRVTNLRSTEDLDPNPGATRAVFSGLNRSIDNFFDYGLNFRIGAEFRVAEQFYIRGGYAYYASVYNEKGRRYLDTQGDLQHMMDSRQFITGGLGYRAESGVYLNVAGMYRIQDDLATTYVSDNFANNAYIQENLLTIMTTVGIYFR
ncbi:MAG: hypothetical protein LW884_03845 [Bacteroidetes bacterium]|jgi:hypothetical protein|nr:hypothetical protein [Bacteroidota bacterium]